VSDDEMLRAFNMGMGMIVGCEARHEPEVLAMLRDNGGQDSVVIGRIVQGNRTVEYV
jgi:phosphoribosylaminoimidazole (AIR) synthetase